MKTFLFLLTLILFLNASAQKSEINYITSYYPIINRAELSIVDSNYSLALRTYDSAFAKTKRGFSKDLFNAMVCAIKIQRLDKAFVYCDSLIAKGVSKEFLMTYRSLEVLRSSDKWQKYIDGYEVKFQKYAKRRDKELKNILDGMFARDQVYRLRPGSYNVYGDSIRFNDSVNLVELKSFIARVGFPNEDMVAKESPLRIDFPTYIVFHHYCQGIPISKQKKYNFLNDFITAVKKGQLDPYRFAYLLSLQGEKSIDLGGWGLIQI
jgi:hypothetical protein